MKRILSGIAPSGDGSLHIGNYLGAVKQFIEFARNNECFLFVADLHALTTIQEQKQLQQNIETLILNEIALLKGFLSEEQFNKIVFFRQSDVPLHTELQTILNNVTPLGLIKRAHAYKDKLAKDVIEDEINLGLFNYPILMAADILLYKPDLVPVGKDQKQHVEITRDIAERFNKIYSGNPSTSLRTHKSAVFKLPEPYIPTEVAVVMGTDGKRKMSKSLGNYISIFDDEAVIKKQVMGTYTDPTRIHADDPGHIEGNMVFSYLDFFGESDKVTEFKDVYQKGQIGDVEVKEYLFASLMRYFREARKHYELLKQNPEEVRRILEKGAVKARAVAVTTMTQVRESVGFTNRYSFFTYEFPKAGDFVSIQDFAKMEIRVGKVVKAENVEKSDKLIRLTVDFAEFGKRTIFTGVRGFGYSPQDFRDKQFLFITNLESKRMPSFVEAAAGKIYEESQGMILAVDGIEAEIDVNGKTKPLFISGAGLPVGAKVR